MDLETFKENIGNRLKIFIKKNGYNQNDFCEIMGINATTLSAVISGRSGLSTDLLYKILMQFPNLSLDWLFAGEGQMALQHNNVVIGENNGMMQINNPPSAEVLAERVRALEEQLKLKDQIIELLKKV